MKVLLTGAAGFIGAAVLQALTRAGHEVVGLDLMLGLAHPAGGQIPPGLHRVDVRDRDALEPLLAGVDVVCHQAAMVGNGVDAQDLPGYASHNDFATAVLLASMASQGVDRLVLASSMVVYGEGSYRCVQHGVVRPLPRREADLRSGVFDPRCTHCEALLGWELVEEDTPVDPRSIYAATKAAQEHYALAWTRQLPGAAIGLRYHNVYGPHMPADTPYSGVAAMFRSAIARGEPPVVSEDGGQMRDFVHVADVAAANVLAVEKVADLPTDTYAAYNICSGRPVSIADVAEMIAAATGDGRLAPTVTGEFRSGDVRHIVASAQRAALDLGFTAAVSPEEGLRQFVDAPLRER